MRKTQSQRGQVLPIWILGILGTFALIFTALNYGNSLRWHIRAQSAADSAAQAVLALQSERWNEETELLYGMNVEEYRIRTLLHGILLASTYSGDCYQTNATTQGSSSQSNDCEAVYDLLTPQYMKAVQRYSQEAALLNQVAANANYTNWLKDAKTMMAGLQTSCNTPAKGLVNVAGGDCAFKYTFVTSTPPTRSQSTTGYGLSTVQEDANSVSIPSYGNASSVDTEDPQLFAPVQVDIVTCTVVPPVIPNFWHIAPQSFMAIGRASATNVMFVQDWFEPGQLLNPKRTQDAGHNVLFQPAENYGTPLPPTSQSHDFYAVSFGGNAAADYLPQGSYASIVTHEEFSVHLGWWNSIPVRPTTNISSSLYASNNNCGSSGSVNGS